jgi:hypothetical protein
MDSLADGIFLDLVCLHPMYTEEILSPSIRDVGGLNIATVRMFTSHELNRAVPNNIGDWQRSIWLCLCLS